MELGLFEREEMVERLAREFYRLLGYKLPKSTRITDVTRVNVHPQERMCVAMADFAVEEFNQKLQQWAQEEEEEG